MRIYIYIYRYIESFRAFNRAKIVPHGPYMGYKIHMVGEVNMSLELFGGPHGGSGMLPRVSWGVPGVALKVLWGSGGSLKVLVVPWVVPGGALWVPGRYLGVPGAPQGTTGDPQGLPRKFLGCLGCRHGRFEKH